MECAGGLLSCPRRFCSRRGGRVRLPSVVCGLGLQQVLEPGSGNMFDRVAEALSGRVVQPAFDKCQHAIRIRASDFSEYPHRFWRTVPLV